MRYNITLLAILAFLSGITIFANAAALLTHKDQSFNHLAARVPPPAPKVITVGGKGGNGAPLKPGSSSGHGPSVSTGEKLPPQGVLPAHRLQRAVAGKGGEPVSEWMEGFVDGGDWVQFKIKQTRRHGAEIAEYSVNPEGEAYITKMIDLGEPKYTDMKYRDMIIDSYKSATGGKTNPKIIGTDNVKNPDVINSFLEVFKARGKQADGELFLKTTKHLASEFFAVYREGEFSDPTWHLVTKIEYV